jgi:hypothetical protein
VRKLRILMFTVTVLATLTSLLASPPAQAGELPTTCAGTLTNTYEPGLTLMPQNHEVTNVTSYSGCLSLSHPAVTSGTSQVTVHAVTSCLIVLQPGSGSKTIEWNTGQHSVFDWNRTVTSVGAVTIVTLTGHITSGLFQGADAVEVETFPVINFADCLATGGLKSRSAVVALEIA